MHSKYYNTVDKIKVDKDFKERLILKLEEEKTNIEEKEVKYIKKEGVIMKIKRVIIAIVSTFMIIAGSGVAYAAFGGTINGVPVLEWMGIKFSDNYTEYVEPVENQVLENEKAKVTLESTVCDDGFTVLQFRVNISEDIVDLYRTEDLDDVGEIAFCYLSFNDPIIVDGDYKYTDLSGANYNIIIDGEKKWVRGKSAQSIKAISESEYLIYQMWFLDETCLDGKEEFKITLNDVVIGLGEDCIGIDGDFNVDVSKEKALNNTTTIVPKDDTKLNYKTMEKTIEKVSITPLQNIIKIKNVYEDISMEELANEEKSGGVIDYIAFDQNDNVIASCTIWANSKITYKDGTVEKCEPGEFDFERQDFEHATYETIDMIAVEQGENINKIKIKVYEKCGYYENEIIKNIMEYTINLKTNDIKSENKNVTIYETQNSILTDEYKNIYYRKYFGVKYNEDSNNLNEVIEVNDEDSNNLSDLIEGNNVSKYNLNDISDVDYVEIKVEDTTSTEGVRYKKPVKIKDSSVIDKLLNIIKDSSEYTNFDEDFGMGGYFEGAPILTIYLKNGQKLMIEPIDEFGPDGSGKYINIMMIYEWESYDKIVYKVNSELQSIIEKLYNN